MPVGLGFLGGSNEVGAPRRGACALRGRARGGLAPLALVVAGLLALSQPARGQYMDVSPWDASLRELRLAAKYSPDGSHHPRLVALRELRDPALRPFFQSLVQGDHWSIQVDGILGLAELDPEREVDPFLLAQLKGETDRSTAIAAALALKMVGAEQAQAMLQWDDLPPADRAMLDAELARLGGRPDADSLKKLIEHRNDDVAGISTFVAAGAAEPERAAELVKAYEARFAALSDRERSATLSRLAESFDRFELKAAAPFLRAQLRDSELSVDARNAAIAALLTLDPTAGYAAWREAVEADLSQSSRVRLGLMLLATDAKLPKDAGAPLRVPGPDATATDPLLLALANAIEAASGHGDASVALPALAKMKHRPSTLALLAASERLDSAAQRATLGAIADLLDKSTRREIPPAVAELAVDAMRRLFKVDPAEAERRLANAKNDDELQELILVALLAADTRETTMAAAKLETTGLVTTRRGSSLILLAKARVSDRLSPDEVKALGVLASGGGRLDGSEQVQAAWLFARHSGKAEQAIASVLAP